jgi:hypothetical protein
MNRFHSAMVKWSKESGRKMFAEWANGSNGPTGLETESAAVALMSAFPKETQPLSLSEVVDILNTYTDTEFKILRAGMREVA